MAETPYFGTYARFETEDKRNAADLLSANNLIGDPYRIEFVESDEGTHADIVNRFDTHIGYLDGAAAYQGQLAQARGWAVCAYLSFVAYTEKPEPGHYWGEVALIAYDPTYQDAIQPFLDKLSRTMANGVRPKIDFADTAFKQLVDSKGTWFPTDRVKMPPKEKGTAVVKDHQGPNDRLVEQSRRGNIGCYVGSWLFLLALVAVIIFGLHSCGLF